MTYGVAIGVLKIPKPPTVTVNPSLLTAVEVGIIFVPDTFTPGNTLYVGSLKRFIPIKPSYRVPGSW